MHDLNYAKSSLEQSVNLENSQSHTDTHDKTVESKMGNLSSLRMLIASQRIMPMICIKPCYH
jgi:hypothetical protein